MSMYACNEQLPGNEASLPCQLFDGRRGWSERATDEDEERAWQEEYEMWNE